jgi:hypothetical protein
VSLVCCWAASEISEGCCWVMGPEMPKVRAVGKECGLEAHRIERNIEGSNLARITGSSCCNQDGVHCGSDMRQSSFC